MTRGRLDSMKVESGGREVAARAPLRVSFAGGGTDVAPYPEKFGGAVLNATINRYAYCQVRASNLDTIRVTSYDLDQTKEYATKIGPEFDGNLDLVTAVLRRINVDRLTPMDVTLHCDAPPGSGLGSSSAIVVALICALAKYLGVTLSRSELAHTAYLVEREDVGIAGGFQDQYASAYGGFNFIEFGRTVNVVPLRLEPYQIYELESQIILASVGDTRLSSGIIEKQTARLESGEVESLAAHDRLRSLAFEARTALLTDQFDDFGRCIDEGWRCKQNLAEAISSPTVERLYSLGIEAGAIAGKLVGAGGGGFMLFVVPPGARHQVEERMENLGIAMARHVNFGSNGALAWERRANLARVHESFGG